MIDRERVDQPAVPLRLHDGQPFSLGLPLPPRPGSPAWRDLGNGVEVDEYLRRQAMSAGDYTQFVRRWRRKFPGESFLIVRFGDHQPSFARPLIDPGLDDSLHGAADRAERSAVPHDLLRDRCGQLSSRWTTSSALDKLDAPYLPIVMLEAAGLPLDPSFAEQKKILQRCHGLFYRCAGGAEARRFNRLLIDAGLIKGLEAELAPMGCNSPRLLGCRRRQQADRGDDGRGRTDRSDGDARARRGGPGGHARPTSRSRFGSPTTAPIRRSRAPRSSVADGEFVAIVGPTGCGKTTLLNVAAGLLGAVRRHGRTSSARRSRA